MLLGIESVALFGMSKVKDSLKTVYEDRVVKDDLLSSREPLTNRSLNNPRLNEALEILGVY